MKMRKFAIFETLSVKPYVREFYVCMNVAYGSLMVLVISTAIQVAIDDYASKTVSLICGTVSQWIADACGIAFIVALVIGLCLRAMHPDIPHHNRI